MPDQKFPNGCQVRLNSGGPIMTVAGFAEYTFAWQYHCRWFDAKKELKEGYFSEAELNRID